TVRALGYLGMATLVGGFFFLAFVWQAGAEEKSARRLLWLAWSVVLVSSVAGIALAGLDRADRGLGSGLWSSALIGDTLEGRFGRAWASRVILAVPAFPLLVALTMFGREAVAAIWWRLPAAAVGIGLVRTPGFVSHATFSEPAWLGTTVDLIHLTALSVWIGGLVMVIACVLPLRRSADVAAVMHRYSTVAFASVAAVVTTGTILAWQLVGTWSSLVTTNYGQALVAKVAIVGLLLVVAQGSRRLVNQRLVPVLLGNSTSAKVAPLMFSVGSEVVLAAAVLGVAALLVNMGLPS
ncbi:MAG: copper resistance D family protein, partial [Pseudonocardiaceae bacterium]